MSGPSATPIRLLIADDHPVVRDGLSGMFAPDPGFEVLGEAADGAEAVRLAQALRPDVILMDLRMPGMDGVTAITELARLGIPARVLVLTTYDTDSHVLPAIEAGATGYLLKDAPRDELFSPKISRYRASTPRNATAPAADVRYCRQLTQASRRHGTGRVLVFRHAGAGVFRVVICSPSWARTSGCATGVAAALWSGVNAGRFRPRGGGSARWLQR
jgi:DNA-binding NarL/FixJ family response regulator